MYDVIIVLLFILYTGLENLIDEQSCQVQMIKTWTLLAPLVYHFGQCTILGVKKFFPEQ
jgi:hypothetical protein